MTQELLVADMMKNVNERNAVEVGYRATRDGVILDTQAGSILIPAAKMEEMRAKMCMLQRQQWQDKIYRGKDR